MSPEVKEGKKLCFVSYRLDHTSKTIQAECPHCGRMLLFLGRRASCPCGRDYTIPWLFYLRLKLKLLRKP